VILWGTIGLGRALLARFSGQGQVDELAIALSLVLVGLPVFLVHGWLIQRSAAQEINEPSARLRAVFLYGVLLATLIPVVQNLLALVNRLLLLAFRLEPGLAQVGGGQSAGDNLVAIVFNSLVAAYFFSLLRLDWQLMLMRSGPWEDYGAVRRLYRYIWLIYAIGLVVLGLQGSLQLILAGWVQNGPALPLADYLAALLVGLPLLVGCEWWIRQSLTDPAERGAPLHLAVYYLLAFSGIAALLVAAAQVLERSLLILFSAPATLASVLTHLSRPLSVALPTAGLWLYYSHRLKVEIHALPESHRRSALRRLYSYGLALLGLVAAIYGLDRLLTATLDLLGQPAAGTSAGVGARFAAGLAYLIVGLPLWYLAWRPMQREAVRGGEAGDHARRSFIRKAYLYSALFAGVLGLMASAAELCYTLVSAALGEPQPEPGLQAAQVLKRFAIFTLLLVAHWRFLRADARQAASALARQHTLFPVLVLAPDEADFADCLVQALQRQAPALPVAVHPYSQGAPDESLSAAGAVILPAELLTRPPEALRLWLQNYTGARIVIPTQAQGWHWLNASTKPHSQAKQAALVVRRLAEGEKRKEKE
jgi:hypothetical protein